MSKDAVTDLRKAKIMVDRKAWEYMTIAAASVDTELGGVAQVDQEEDGVLYVHSPKLLKQEVGSADVHLDQEELTAWLKEQFGPFTRMPYNAWCWWHSHGTMSTGFSPTDHEFVRDWATRGPLVSIVTNCKGERYSRVDAFVGHEYDTKRGFFIEIPSEFSLTYSMTQEEVDSVEASVKENVKKKAATLTRWTDSGWWGGGSWGPADTKHLGTEREDLLAHSLLDHKVGKDGKTMWLWPVEDGDTIVHDSALPGYVCKTCGRRYTECQHRDGTMKLLEWLEDLEEDLGKAKDPKEATSYTGRNGAIFTIYPDNKVKAKIPGKGTIKGDLSMELWDSIKEWFPGLESRRAG